MFGARNASLNLCAFVLITAVQFFPEDTSAQTWTNADVARTGYPTYLSYIQAEKALSAVDYMREVRRLLAAEVGNLDPYAEDLRLLAKLVAICPEQMPFSGQAYNGSCILHALNSTARPPNSAFDGVKTFVMGAEPRKLVVSAKASTGPPFPNTKRMPFLIWINIETREHATGTLPPNKCCQSVALFSAKILSQEELVAARERSEDPKLKEAQAADQPGREDELKVSDNALHLHCISNDGQEATTEVVIDKDRLIVKVSGDLTYNGIDGNVHDDPWGDKVVDHVVVAEKKVVFYTSDEKGKFQWGGLIDRDSWILTWHGIVFVSSFQCDEAPRRPRLDFK